MRRLLPVNSSFVRVLFATHSSFVHSFKLLFTVAVILTGVAARAQTDVDAAYKKTLTDRSAKIVNTLQLTDSATYYKVLDQLVDQYIQVNNIHDQHKKAVAEIKSASLSAEAGTEAIKKQEEKKSAQLLQRHHQFTDQLKKYISGDQLDKIKDGMTYKVFPITYAGYLDMLPALTTDQKEKIYNWLKEARELAMDEGSSEDKHKVFGKYKGRINNYLSAEGYDLKKETADWQKRIKERNAAKKEQAK